MPLNPETIANLKEKHSDIYLLEAGEHEVVVRPPTRGEYRRFRAMATDDRKKPEAVETLLRDCVLYPESAEIERLLEKKPALADIFGGKVLELAGATEEARGKQL